MADGQSSSSDEVEITVKNVRPTIGEVSAGPTATDGLAQVSAAFADPGVVDQHGLRFDWGDGSPPETVASQIGGTGWGYGFAGHVYAAEGDKTVSVTALDDDGGESEVGSVTFNVGAAGPGEPVPGAALWALGTGPDPAITVTGEGTSVDGLVHANGSIRIAGSGARFSGGAEYGTTLDVHGGGATFDPPATKAAAGPAPYAFPIADWRPGGREAIALGAAFHDVSSGCTGGGANRRWQPQQVLGCPPAPRPERAVRRSGRARPHELAPAILLRADP